MCQRVKHQDDWLEAALKGQEPLSHGFCPECYEKTMHWVGLRFAKPEVKKKAIKNK